MKLPARLLFGMAALAMASSAQAAILSITNNPVSISGTVGTDYLIYKQVGATLVNDNLQSVASVLSGAKTQTAPGGDIRLYLNSYTDSLAAFATAAHVALSGSLGGHSVSLSSLNGADWFTDSSNAYNTNYGASNLANQWFNDFFAAYNFNAALTLAGYSAPFIAAERANLFSTFLNNPPANGSGFQHLSGTTISYAQEDTSTGLMSIGLADTDGFLFPLIKNYVTATAPNVVPFLPADVDASKAVLVSVDGGVPVALYSFSSDPSGLATTDGTNSDNLEFQVTSSVPEPASASLLLGAGTLLLRRRRKTA